LKSQYLARKYYNWVSLILFAYFLVFLVSASIAQDDYATLSDLTTDGFYGPVIGVWNTLGGNIASVVPRSMALGLGFQIGFPVGLVIYSITTLALMLISFDFLLGYLVSPFQSLAVRKRLPILLILALGFEGIFTPGEVGVLGFSAAAGVHVWPISFVVIGAKLFSIKTRLSLLGAMFAFLYAGNSNIPEGVLAVIVAIAMCYSTVLQDGRLIKKKKVLGYLGVPLISAFGLLVIFVAPGFQARSQAVGVSFAFNDLAVGVIRAAMYFLFDILTHPFIFLAVFLGYAVGKFGKLTVEKKSIRNVGITSILYFLLLVAGAGVAYPAWHQTFGMFVLLLPLSFAFGVHFASVPRVQLPAIRIFLIPLLIACLLVSLRSGYTTVERKLSWQSNFAHNVCVAKGLKSGPYLGSEITYPPMNLGIEDLSTWPWMADAFKKWINGSNFVCELQ
jgi:hypothetical protein